MTPVLTCIVHEQPGEEIQMLLRRAASTYSDAIEAAESIVRSRLQVDGKVLVHFYGRVEDDGRANSHCRYKMVDISYTYSLDNWPVTECRSTGATKNAARQNAARKLIESEAYCMFVRKSKRASRR
ncbi:dsrm domain protein, putative [Rhizoctonia solani AG-3 Rhs1AP]|nr:dsrm domain protein, putative [Rhizoctonia solani AG-3 Rhs1AP]